MENQVKVIDIQKYLKENKSDAVYPRYAGSRSQSRELGIYEIKTSFNKLKKYCEIHDYKGYDPYDGLNSPFIRKSPLWRFPLIRLIWIQGFKRFPVNLRKIFLIDKEHNPKGLALFLTAYCNLFTINPNQEYLSKINQLARKLIDLKCDRFSGAAWGYNFPWQSKVGLFPKYAPTVVTTAFASCALMDAFDCTHDSEYLDTALSSCEFVLNDLKRTPRSGGFIFSYSPFEESTVYNASLLGSRLLARGFKYRKNERWLEGARASALSCAKAQREDGAWPYGDLPFQNWVDSFHTGFNLECFSEYQKYSGDGSFTETIRKGYSYYIDNFFCDDGAPKYYDKQKYPLDIHSPAQFLVTMFKLDKLKEQKELINRVLTFTIKNLQDKEGFFYYQTRKLYTCKIPYMRWSQAWMLYAFSFFFLGLVPEEADEPAT